MDNLFASFCLYLQTHFGSMNSEACDKAIMATYSHSYLETGINDTQSYYQKKANEFTQENKTIVYSGIVGSQVYKTIYNKELQLSVPLKPFCEQISIDAKPNGVYNYTIDWRFNF